MMEELYCGDCVACIMDGRSVVFVRTDNMQESRKVDMVGWRDSIERMGEASGGAFHLLINGEVITGQARPVTMIGGSLVCESHAFYRARQANPYV